METEITKFLDGRKIPYRRLPHAEAVFTCEEAAKQRGVRLEEMVKTMVLVDKDKKYFLACILASDRVELEKTREMLKCKRLSFANDDEIASLGYVKGAIAPLMAKIPVIFDEKIAKLERLNISSGNPRMGLELKASDLIKLANPVIGSVSE